MRELRTFIDGLVFGAAQTVPGVSGGTVAIILGFYGRLIDTVNNFTKDYRKHLRFLIPFMLGTAAGIITFSSVVNYFLTNFSLPTMLFFIGMISGVIPVICSKLRRRALGEAEPAPLGVRGKIRQPALVIIPALLLAAVSHLTYAPLADPAEAVLAAGIPFMIFLFFIGIIAAASLVTPGISGSFVMLLFGVYHILTYSVSSIRYLPADITNIALWLDICKITVPFGIGVLIGGISMAKLISKLLRDHSQTVYSVILGLIIGSVYALFRQPIVFASGVSPAGVIIGIIMFLAGFAASFLLGKKRINDIILSS